jgi:rsbT co-antagonist protein RsbR
MKVDVSKLLKKRKKEIFESWLNNQLLDESLREDLISNDEMRDQRNALLDALLNSISNTNLADPSSNDFEPVNEILQGLSISRAKQGFSPRETGAFIFSLKDAVIHALQSEIPNDPVVLYDLMLKVSRLFDRFSVVTFETFIHGREEVILRQTDEITEISTPVIRVWDGILALPIIGTLDSSRTQVVMEALLQEIVETSSSIAILDISGVPAVDSLVAQHLIKTVAATRLMGAECIISGIRPEIAQTIVHLGIDLSKIVTKSSLAAALKYSFAMLQLEVRKSQKEKTNILHG